MNLCGCFFNTSERDGGGPNICEVVAPVEVEEAPAVLTINLNNNPSDRNGITALNPARRQSRPL